MGAPVGSLIVRIGSDIRGLVSGFGAGGKLTREFGDLAAKTAKRIAVIGTAAAAAGAALTAKLTRDGLKSVDAMAKFARMVGISTESLAGLQNAAAQTAGFTGDQFNLALQRMTRRIAEAAQGTGEAQGAIKALGLDAKALADAGPEQAFLMIADAIQSVEDQGERLRLGFKFFDSEGARLVNTLSAGRAEIERLMREAKELGIAFSEVDARQVEAANDALERMSAVVAGVSRMLAVKLSPFIQEVADRFTAAAKGSQGFADEIDASISFAIRLVGRFADVIRGVELGIEALRVGTVQAFATTLDIAAKLNEPSHRVARFFGLTESDISELSIRAELAAGKLEQMQNALALMASQPMPSAGIEKFLRDVQERARLAAEAAEAEAKARESAGGGDRDDPAERERQEAELEKRREALAQRVELIRQSLLSERELLEEDRANKMAALVEAARQGIITEEELLHQREELNRQHQDTLTEITERGEEDRKRLEDQKRKERARNIATQFDAIGSMAASLNQALFQNSKEGAIAESIMLGIAGAIRTWNAYPWPWNILPTAAHIAGTAAQIAQIQSASFSSRSNPTAPSIAAAGAGGAPVVPVGAAGSGGSSQLVSINLNGDIFGRQQVRDLISQINSAVADGARLVVR